jgi:hypothetical protein
VEAKGARVSYHRFRRGAQGAAEPKEFGIDGRGVPRKAGCASMTDGRAFPILIFTLLISGCSDSREQAMKTVKRVTPEQLRLDAAKFYKDMYAGPRNTLVQLNKENWTRSFAELNPDRITAYVDGFAFRLESSGDSESGLYVVPLGMDIEPKQTDVASFEKISEGIFWYSFKP